MVVVGSPRSSAAETGQPLSSHTRTLPAPSNVHELAPATLVGEVVMSAVMPSPWMVHDIMRRREPLAPVSSSAMVTTAQARGIIAAEVKSVLASKSLRADAVGLS